jgi:serine/threonine protein kinase
MALRKDPPRHAQRGVISLPGWAHAIAALGPETERIILEYFAHQPASGLFSTADQEALKTLADSLHTGWSDAEAAKIFTAYTNALASHRKVDISALSRWVLLHMNDSAAVIDCMNVDPPDEISIIRVLSRAGSQKLVFLATWRLNQTQVVLKKLTGPPELVRQIVDRELQLHPLSRAHPNIIETHFLKNAKGEVFLAEQCLPEVLSDKWDSHGVQEAANLLYNIADAVTFLHQNNLVHGDIKPDNIGVKGTRYILLDFGICRPAEDFKRDTTATGSLRTRAPELLETDSYVDPCKVDVWALGATLFNSLAGRFPLFDKGEFPPRVSHPSERGEFEKELSRRAREEWTRRVDLKLIPQPIRPLIDQSLRREVEQRYSADQLKKEAERSLAAFLRVQSTIGRFSPLDELNQLRDYLPEARVLRLMPTTEMRDLKDRLVALRDNYGFSPEHRAEVEALLTRIG